jgi:hypothetical protein
MMVLPWGVKVANLPPWGNTPNGSTDNFEVNSSATRAKSFECDTVDTRRYSPLEDIAAVEICSSSYLSDKYSKGAIH